MYCVISRVLSRREIRAADSRDGAALNRGMSRASCFSASTADFARMSIISARSCKSRCDLSCASYWSMRARYWRFKSSEFVPSALPRRSWSSRVTSSADTLVAARSSSVRDRTRVPRGGSFQLRARPYKGGLRRYRCPAPAAARTATERIPDRHSATRQERRHAGLPPARATRLRLQRARHPGEVRARSRSPPPPSTGERADACDPLASRRSGCPAKRADRRAATGTRGRSSGRRC